MTQGSAFCVQISPTSNQTVGSPNLFSEPTCHAQLSVTILYFIWTTPVAPLWSFVRVSMHVSKRPSTSNMHSILACGHISQLRAILTSLLSF
ncbi:hypothetical protein BU24DRAFT_427196 [Aaosphaeria arxii CBS 175.79]|uniref:Uncharacterized protein n=1 Tax=Aaosphaeria arxii CBS 175.79 TaxID=1450172 RepID=A0A6A5XD04_9PLEO|nr:uncharacterized protein BU24DRAFT_427196 [Aaosphaeria arxii CBS 175.79]KAF2010995.1 hypothetical protein BU24DRAFT_427196 [Aaosphaeria arxii CBS 175.79]